MHASQVITLFVAGMTMFGVIGFLSLLAHYYTLNGIKSRTVGDGQHGTARFATNAEIKRAYKQVAYLPDKWRSGDYSADVWRLRRLLYYVLSKLMKNKITPKSKTVELPKGVIIGQKKRFGKTYALVDDADVHTLMIGAAGVGKTASFLYPNLEYACASGMSFLSTDTKGDLFRSYGTIAKGYGYDVAVLDLRNPTKSDGFNLLYLVNKYMDMYLRDNSNLAAKAHAEKYAKITAKTIINAGDSNKTQFGQNAFFYDAAEGLLTAAILLIAEFCPPPKRHIISVFKLIQDLLAPSGIKGKNQFQLLIDKLPPEHKARWFAGAALNTAEQAMASVLSTALSRLNAFLDSELEQVLCFDTCIDAERFCSHKSAIFLVMPEEDATKYFMISLIIQQIYREILSIADEKGI